MFLSALLASGAWWFLSRGRAVPVRRAAVSWSETRPPAEEALRRDVAARPDDAAAHGRLGRYYLEQVLPFEAIWSLAETRRLRPSDPEARLGLVAALQGVQLPQMAAELLEEPSWAPAGDLTPRLALARLRLKYGDAAAAARALHGAEAALIRSPEALLLQGRVRQALGDRAGSESAYRRYLALDPSSADGHYRLGRLLLEAGRTRDARIIFAAGSRAVPGDARFPFYLGLTHVAGLRGESTQPGDKAAEGRASTFFEAALRLAPGHALPHYQLGRLHARHGRWDPAARHFKAAVDADASYVDAYRELANALGKLGKRPYDAYYRGLYFSKVERPVQAVREFRTVAALRPNSAEGALLVSRMYIQTMQYSEAVAAAEPALRRFPNDPAVYERLAVLYKLLGSRGAVERLCGQWRTTLPQASEPHWVLGRVRVTDGRVEEGIREYEQALALEPDRAEYQLFLGQALVERAAPSDLPRALELIGRAVRSSPRDAAARLQLALLLQRLGRLDEARDQLLRALDLDMHQTAPYNSLSQIAGQLRSPTLARLFGRALRLVEARVREEEAAMRRVWRHPRDADAHLAAADFRRRTGALAQAKAHLEQALELRPGWPAAARELRRVTLMLEVQ